MGDPVQDIADDEPTKALVAALLLQAVEAHLRLCRAAQVDPVTSWQAICLNAEGRT